MKIYLASASPRRRELLDKIDIPFEAFSVDVDESLLSKNGKKEAIRLAKKKCLKACDFLDSLETDSVILSADTLVWRGRNILGKPKNREDAFYMLKFLSGKWHCVTTAYSILYIDKNNIEKFFNRHITTKIKFRNMSNSDIEKYLDTGEWNGVAGAYRIQSKGENYVEKIRGSFSNVVGLPICQVEKDLRNLL